ncbi:QacE family quaternary ammonium compound efflux SMR transporter [Aeromicrobium camelliae]|uniref:QacE family quaternary ammonium compound efflux SMR transporter n=1 Tax=Aeromicrobium camelliae TaxID=1538144 RepID=A0A3N6WKD9_9ACTN|nr:SMR family transporter [Aeromicrobium camelliae]RQN02255.1 QacE family quaternary ammonium compound efflux SMR transporter [Aeromicrobium camelliae]
MKKWFLLACAIAAEVVATMALRASIDHSAWIALVVAGYLAAFTVLALALREHLPIGVAYGIWGATGVALTAVLGAAIFGEVLSPPAIAGLVLIIVGVVLVETGSRHGEAAS